MIYKIRDDANKAKLKGLVKDLKALNRHLIIRAKNTGSWMAIQVTIITDTVLAAADFLDFCVKVMILPPPKPPFKKR